MPGSVAETPPKLDSIGFDALLERNNPFEDGDCRFDLTGLRLVTPAGMVQLAAACHALRQRDQRPTITLPSDDVCRYLGRAGWLKAIRGAAVLRPLRLELVLGDRAMVRGANPMLLEVTLISRGPMLPMVLDQVVAALRLRLRYSKAEAFDIATAVSEACQNTFDHNQGTCGFAAMQVYRGQTGSFVEIAVSDYGVGLRATLSRNPRFCDLKSDGEAIQQAIKRGASQYHDDPTRGTGLFHLLEIAYRHRGSVQLRSGGAKARYRMDKRRGWMFRVPRMPGVHAVLTLPSKNVS